jgi:Zn-dependent protease
MFRRSSSVRLITIAGIRVGVDLSWFVTLFLMIFLLSGPFRTALHSSDGVAYLTTVATVLLFFGSLIVHELGHALAARREGIPVGRIELFLFGGVTHMGREPGDPVAELKIALAGPLGTLVFVLACLALDLALVGPHRLAAAVFFAGGVKLTPVLLSLSWLVPMNVLILAFNLVPAYPLDGGRIARAVVWRATGDRDRGSRAAARLGQGFALLLGGFGLWLFSGRSTFTGAWLMILAFLLWQSARTAMLQSQVSSAINAVLVEDIMEADPVTLPEVTPLSAALEDFFRRSGAGWLPVVDESGHFLGISERDRVQAASDGGDGWLTVRAVLDLDRPGMHVELGRPLTDVLALDALGRLGGVVAVDGQGIVRGVVTADGVRRALATAFTGPRLRRR